MTTDDKSIELAKAGVEFLNTVGRSAISNNLPRGLVVRLLGAFVKRLIEQDVGEGEDHAEATQRAIGNLMRGLGFEQEGGPDPRRPLQ